MVKPVKFTRDSGCLARDEFLVISEGPGSYVDIHICNFLYCWALYYIFTLYLGLLSVHRMTLVSFRLFRKHLGNLRD